MKIIKKSFVPLAAGLVLTVGSAWSQLLPLPEEKSFGAVTYVTGGVPDEQLPALRAAREDYPLAIEIYQKAGAKSEYTADADVTVTDGDGNTVLEAKADGPFLYAKVPPGTYRVKATLGGKSVETKGVRVGDRSTTSAVLVFPSGTD